MKKLILSTILLMASAIVCFGQGAAVAFPGVTNPQGQPVPGVTLHFCSTPTVVTSGVCSTPVTVYTDIALTTPYSSAIRTDGLGNFPPIYFTPAANYCYSISGFPAATNTCYPFSVGFTGTGGALNIPGNLTLTQTIPATALANNNSFSDCTNATYWTGTVSATDQWCLQDILGAGSNPTSTFTLTHSGSSGAANFSVPGNVSVGGTLGAARLFKRCFVDGVTYTTIAGAYNDSTNCMSVWLPPNYTETFLANLTLNRASVPIICEAKCTITQNAFQVLVTKGTNHVSVISFMLGGADSNGTSAGFSWVYTGTGNAWQVGDNTGTSTIDFYAKGIYWNLNGAGASATGIKIFNTQKYAVDDSECFLNAASQVCYATDGTGSFTGDGTFLRDGVRTGVSAATVTAYKFGTLSTHTQIIGGSWALDAAAGIGIDVLGPNTGSIELVNPNCNTALTCIVVESTATSSAAVVGDIRTDSGVTNLASFATGTKFNHIRCIDCATTAAVTDTDGPATSGNSIETIDGNVMNSRFWTTKASATAWALTGPSAIQPLQCTTGNCFIGVGSGNAKLLVDNGSRLTIGEASAGGGNANLCTMWASSSTHQYQFNCNNAGTKNFDDLESAQTFTGAKLFTTLGTATNCSSTGGTCGSAAAGSVGITNPATTVTVSTTAVTANSQIFVFEDSTLGTKLTATCNATAGRTYMVTTRTAGVSFIITASATPAANTACLSYLIVN